MTCLVETGLLKLEGTEDEVQNICDLCGELEIAKHII
jgi:hypothetical protein